MSRATQSSGDAFGTVARGASATLRHVDSNPSTKLLTAVRPTRARLRQRCVCMRFTLPSSLCVWAESTPRCASAKGGEDTNPMNWQRSLSLFLSFFDDFSPSSLSFFLFYSTRALVCFALTHEQGRHDVVFLIAVARKTRSPTTAPRHGQITDKALRDPRCTSLLCSDVRQNLCGPRKVHYHWILVCRQRMVVLYGGCVVGASRLRVSRCGSWPCGSVAVRQIMWPVHCRVDLGTRAQSRRFAKEKCYGFKPSLWRICWTTMTYWRPSRDRVGPNPASATNRPLCLPTNG